VRPCEAITEKPIFKARFSFCAVRQTSRSDLPGTITLPCIKQIGTQAVHVELLCVMVLQHQHAVVVKFDTIFTVRKIDRDRALNISTCW
jgi:hypothetical protein